MVYDVDTGLVDGKYSVKDFIDLGKLRWIFKMFSRASGFSIGFLDHPGMKLLLATGQREICLKFHRPCLASMEQCLVAKEDLLGRLVRPGETVIETCGNGLQGCGIPIMLKGRRVGSLVTCQLLSREPDLEYFKKQAARYGFDEEKYLKAVKEVPIVPEEKIRDFTAYLGELASLIVEQGYDRLELRWKNENLEAALASRDAAESALRVGEAKYKALFDNSTAAIFITDVETERILDVNKNAERLTGRTKSELIGMARAELHPREQVEYYRRNFHRGAAAGSAVFSDAVVERKDGRHVPVQVSSTVMEIGGRKVMQGLFEDISGRKRIEDELKISEQKFRDLAESVPDLVWETDESGCYTYVSPRMKELLGYEMWEVIGKSPFEPVAGESGEEEAGDFNPFLLQKAPFHNIEHTRRHKDGRLIAMEAGGNPVFDEAGRYRGYRGITRDITARKRLEDENKLKAMLLDSVTDAVFLHDLEGRIVYANEAAHFQVGHSEEEMRNMMFQQLLTKASAEKFDKHTHHAVKLGKTMFSAELTRKDGGIIPVETNAHGLELEGEMFVLRVVRDVTERKHAERAMKESEEKFRVTFENAPIGMALIDTDGRILVVNSALCARTGYSPAELLHHDLDAFTYPEDIPLCKEWLKKITAEEPAAHTIEKRYLGKDGRIINTEVSATLLKRAHGAPMNIVVAIQDITARKKAEAEQEQLMKELKRTNSDISQFNSLIAHDLQEPLRMVRSYSQLLAKRVDGKLDEPARDFLGYVLNGGELMQKMLEDLMRYLRVGGKAEEQQDVDMSAVMSHVLSLLRASIEDSGTVVSCGHLPVVKADKVQMTHLLQNLVGNAIKFRGTAPPRISVSCVPAENEYIFTVRDNGIGIAPQFYERVFKIFQRLHSREEYQGTGVGLALCKKIVENLGGRIWVESELGKGTAFYFTLPRRAGGAPANDGKAPAEGD